MESDPRFRPPHLRSRSLPFVAACVVAASLVIAAYSNSLDNSFHFDDSHVIEENIFIRDLRNVPRFFTDARTFSCVPTNATYRPIVSTSLAVDHAIAGGLKPRTFHVTQILLLLVTGAMLVALFHRLLAHVCAPWSRWTALSSATFFCVHTGNTQPINYISARSELLAGIGVLGALLTYVFLPRARRFQLHLLPMAFGILAKTPAVIAAPLLLVYDLMFERGLSWREVFTRSGWPRTRAALVAIAPAFAAALALYLFVEGMSPPGQTYGGGGRLRYLVTETWVWVHYARLFVWPAGLSADTDLELFASPWDPRVAAGVAFALAMLALAWVASKRLATRPIAFGLVWFAIALAPSSTFFPLAEVANDHRVYFPFMGLALAIAAWLMPRLVPDAAARPGSTARLVFAALAVAAVLGAHAAGTYRRNRVWRTEETLWADVVRKSPTNGRGKMNYGLTHMAAGRYERAKELFLEARERLPNYATLEVNLGIVENALGDVAAADRHFARALTLSPDHPATHRYYARWLIRQGRAGEAVHHLERALALSPADLEVRHMLMGVHAARGGPDLARLAAETLGFASSDTLAACYARGEVPLRPAAPVASAWYTLGSRLTAEDRHVEAAQAYRAALAIDSTHADAWNNLGWSLAKLGLFDEALPAFRGALRHRPGDELAANNLAWAAGEVSNAGFKRAFALQRTGRGSESVPIYRALLATHPRWVNAHYNLGHALMGLDHHAEAVAEFRRTLELDPDQTAAHLHLATCLEALGQAAEARIERERWQRAVAEPTGVRGAEGDRSAEAARL